MTTGELAYLYEAIAEFLNANNIEAHARVGCCGTPFLQVYRTAMCQAFQSEDYPEGKNGAYNQTLEFVQLQFPDIRLMWGGKTDEVLSLEII